MQSSFLQNELDALFDGDILSILDGREKQEQKLESQKAMELQCPSGHGSGEKTLTFELVSQYFCMPIKQAAQELTVGLTLLKSRCRALGIPRWPYRKVKSLQALIRNVQELATETGQDEKMTMNTVEMLQQTKKLMEQSPDVELDHWTKSLRQACFKENYKRRRLLADCMKNS
uniref:RWP-RK domain-containing protein n=1 Tax=Leersia perrieri TaxID=77586 RepID=A0A0D9VKZ2_9ORYZ